MVYKVKYDQVKNISDEQFIRLTGIKRVTFDKMIKRRKRKEVEIAS